MRIPRDISGRQLIKSLRPLGYEVTRQTGSHIRITKGGTAPHNVTIPDHKPIKLGTLNNILRDVAAHTGMSRDELLQELFG